MRPDDRNLSRDERERVERQALRLLHKADAWGMIPVPVEDILAAAKLRVAPYSVFDPRAIAAYAAAQGLKAANLVKRAVGKIFGILDTSEEVIHIDDSVTEGRQTFLKLHEAGHFELPHQKKLFRFFEDSREELDPAVADLFEREANNFASFVMFNGATFQDRAAQFDLSFGSVKKMQRAFKVSLYAALRQYTRTHRLPCIAICCELPEFCPRDGFRCEVRRIEVSPAFEAQFAKPVVNMITARHPFGALVPFARKATRPTAFAMVDRNGTQHEFVGEALDTTFNVLVFACPVVVFKT